MFVRSSQQVESRPARSQGGRCSAELSRLPQPHIPFVRRRIVCGRETRVVLVRAHHSLQVPGYSSPI